MKLVSLEALRAFSPTTKEFVLKIEYRGYEVSITPRDGVNVYLKEKLLWRDTGEPLGAIAAAKEFIEQRILMKGDITE